jgi:polyisoprenyl-teichoic acid--peptidoglycan teichoic acid transferase
MGRTGIYALVLGSVRQVIAWTLLLALLAGCAAPLAPAPQVMVTRVPLDVSSAAAPAVAIAGLAVSADATAPLRASGALTATVLTLPGTPGEVEAELLEPEQPLIDEASSMPTAAVVIDPSLRALQQTRNILLIGTDQRDLEAVGRTDTVMVLAIDAANNRASLISFPRDMYLPIPGVGYSRINTAYAYGEELRPGGGLPLLMSTIERNFGIPIERYVRIDFSGFQGVIDALGGVDVVVDCPLYDELIYRYFQTYTLEPGTYRMNGEQALYYARSRKTTSDFDRSRRQQRVMLAVRSRILDGNLLPRIPALWLAMRDIVDTNLGPADIADLAKLGASLQSKDLYGMVIRYPLVTDWTTPQGGMVQLPDLPAINAALNRVWERQPLQQTNDEERLCQ